MAYLPLDRYDADLDLRARFPRDFCRRWCVLPFDRMSKTILIATANPFNQQAIREVKEATNHAWSGIWPRRWTCSKTCKKFSAKPPWYPPSKHSENASPTPWLRTAC